MTEIRVKKSVGVVVSQKSFTPALKAQKSVGVVVTQIPNSSKALVEKAVGVVVTQLEISGNARQETSGNRPAYRAGPLPYVECGAGESLSTAALTGQHTLVVYRPDDTVAFSSVDLPDSDFVLPTEDFNQLILIRGTLSRIAQASIAYSLRVRSGVI